MLENPEQFSNKKKAYFFRLGLSVREALKLHRKSGLWERKEGKRDWGNVSEHCLVEVARVSVLADKLDLPEDIKKDLIAAATLHDFFKKGEKEIVSAEGLSWDSFEKASFESTRRMKEAGFSERTVRLANSSGYDSLGETKNILNKESLSPEDLAYLAFHYVDDYTIGSDWANPAEISSDGSLVNDFNRRMLKNETNRRYARLNEDGRKYFGGETTFEAQRRIGHLVEKKIAVILSDKIGRTVDAKDLPQFIDEEIKSRIGKL